MAAYFQLVRKSDPDAGPVKFSAIDAEICALFEAPIDPKWYFLSWYDAIGFKLAHGRLWEEVRTELAEEWKADAAKDPMCQEILDALLKISTWLEERFAVNSWHGR